MRPVPNAAGPDHRAMSQVRKETTLGSPRTKHQRFANRRKLGAEYDVALVDIRILPMSGKALDTATTIHGLPFSIKQALAGTYLTLG